MANSIYFYSLLWTAFHEIKKDKSDQKSAVEREFETFYTTHCQQNNSEINLTNFEHLSDSYRNTFDASNKGQVFIQNNRFKNEFTCEVDSEKDLIGYGGYGEVFKATHIIDDQVYAIKKQTFQSSGKKETNTMVNIALKGEVEKHKEIKHLLRELKVNAVIKYDYLLQYKSYWFETDRNLAQLYIQMELCAMDLRKFVTLAEKMLPNIMHLFVITNIFEEIVKGVKYLHTYKPHPIIHRDLKPENILLTKGENGRFVKIADFGFAVFHDTDEHSKDKGSAHYTAPEVKFGNYDTLADIYSLGMVLAKISNFLAKINISDSDRPLYDSKLNNLMLLKAQMIDHIANKRPTCEQILDDKSWQLSDTEVKSIGKLRSLIENSSNTYNISDTFFEYFTYEKLKSSNVMCKKSSIITRFFQLT